MSGMEKIWKYQHKNKEIYQTHRHIHMHDVCVFCRFLNLSRDVILCKSRLWYSLHFLSSFASISMVCERKLMSRDSFFVAAAVVVFALRRIMHIHFSLCIQIVCVRAYASSQNVIEVHHMKQWVYVWLKAAKRQQTWRDQESKRFSGCAPGGERLLNFEILTNRLIALSLLNAFLRWCNVCIVQSHSHTHNAFIPNSMFCAKECVLEFDFWDTFRYHINFIIRYRKWVRAGDRDRSRGWAP